MDKTDSKQQDDATEIATFLKESSVFIIKDQLKGVLAYQVPESEKSDTLEVPLENLVTLDHVWSKTNKNGTVHIMTHEGVKELVDKLCLNVSMHSMLVKPLTSNLQEHAFTFVCVNPHLDKTIMEIGEASLANTNGLSSRYPANMAYKRGHDRAVLASLNLSGKLYSEQEADDFTRDGMFTQITPEELRGLSTVLNQIQSAQTEDDLNLVRDYMNDMMDGLSDSQKKYVKESFVRRLLDVQL